MKNGQIIGLMCLIDIFERILKMELHDGDVHSTLRNCDFVVEMKDIHNF